MKKPATALMGLALCAIGSSAPLRAQGMKSTNPGNMEDKHFDSLFESSQAGRAAAGATDAGEPAGGAAGQGEMPQGHPDVTGDGAGAGDPHAGMGGTGNAGVTAAHGGRMPSMLPAVGAVPPGAVKSVGALETVPIMHEGRLKPMITYARHMLLQFSGKTSYEGQSALEVMAHILFTPELTGDYRIFLINNPEAAEALGIAAEKSRRYSFHQLEKALPKVQELAEKANGVEEEKRDLIQKEVLRIFGNVVEFVNLTRTFTYALPNGAFTVHGADTRAALGFPPDKTEYSFWDLMQSAQAIAKILEGIGNRDEAHRSPMEREIIALSQSMYFTSQSLHPSSFRNFPSPTAAAAGGPGWISPSEVLSSPDQLQAFRSELTNWGDAIAAYRKGDQAGFDKGIQSYLGTMENRAYAQLSETHFSLEALYQKGEPFFWALVAYWLALLGCFGYFLVRKAWMYQAATWIFLAGYAIHLAGIISRIVIMKRPPVTSLYETFPFVAAVSILAALIMERINAKRKSSGQGIGLLCASLLGMILLSIANRYAAEGDTMKMLVAVLNSNFWLSTHVVCVTIGYSACLLAGAIGHVWLIRAVFPGDASKPERLKEISKMVYGTLCFGLLFSFIGTVLGGIWADQSWGRFWGWDPKENGALLIVLWCIILLHAKQWGYIRNPGLALGSVFGAIVVSLAWFGVNLLNVGLHSYGFTTGAATKLFSYIGGELAFMLVTGIGYRLGWGKNPVEPKRAGAAPPAAKPQPG